MKLIVGLGNPGPMYEFTRHNAGFLVLDQLAKNFAGDFVDKGSLYEMSKLSTDDIDFLLVKPLTYMNLSGKAVSKVLSFYKIKTEDLLVIHDDVSLPLGKIRFQSGGGAGGQHGIESIFEYIGEDKKFDRLKIGVGPDPGGAMRADFVLSVPKEKELYTKIIEMAAKEASPAWLKEGIDVAMNKFNGLSLENG